MFTHTYAQLVRDHQRELLAEADHLRMRCQAHDLGRAARHGRAAERGAGRPIRQALRLFTTWAPTRP